MSGLDFLSFGLECWNLSQAEIALADKRHVHTEVFMEKISSILPSNARVKSVDMAAANPIRPGTPAYGRPVGTTASERDRITVSETARELASRESVASQNPKETAKAKVVEQMTRNFFETRLKPVQEAKGETALSQRISDSNVDLREFENLTSEIASKQNPVSSKEEIL